MRAKLNRARHRAIPPDAWEDIHLDPETQIPYKAMRRMRNKGWSKEKAIRRLRKKFKLSTVIAMAVARREYGR